MRLRIAVVSIAVLAFACLVTYAQKPFVEYPGTEYVNFPLPPDWQEKTEFTRARLMYPSARGGWRRFSSWTIDYPRSDRHLLAGIRRLTRLHTRSVEQVVSLDDPDDIYNWPFLYAVEVGHWDLTEAQCKKLRDYLHARRIPDDRRFPRHPGMGRLHGQHEPRVPGPPRRGSRQ